MQANRPTARLVLVEKPGQLDQDLGGGSYASCLTGTRWAQAAMSGS